MNSVPAAGPEAHSTERTKLLPCPFCGETPTVDCAENHSEGGGPDSWLVCCGTAYCYGNAFTLDNAFHTKKHACEVWNNRPLAAVQPQVSQTWYAPTSRRRFLTKKAACVAEARARIKIKYPRERSETDERGRLVDPGWYWGDLPRSEVLLKRYARVLFRSLPNP